MTHEQEKRFKEAAVEQYGQRFVESDFKGFRVRKFFMAAKQNNEKGEG